MKHARLELARSAELLPELSGQIAVFGQIELERLRGLDHDRLRCVNHSFAATENLTKSGVNIARELSETPDHAVVFVPRSKSEAWHLIGSARQSAPNGWIIVDGQKTDGIESISKQIARKVPDVAVYSKGHGKTVWFRAEDAVFLDEFLLKPNENQGGYQTAPGVFSADHIDPASEMLVNEIPRDLSGRFGDIGAGWGYLSERLLKENLAISALHLVEDNGIALDCARSNVLDSRAEFYWADALRWTPSKLLDGIVMNPPFHKGRSAEPELGKDFVKSAARMLRPGGKLFMVANAHLPYETILEQCFAKSELLARSNKFKVFCATRGRDRLS